MISNKTLYKVAILYTLVLIFGILSNGGNLVQAQVNTGTIPPPGGGALPPPPSGAVPPPGGAVGTITTPTAAIPSSVITLQVYDNSTMVLEFGNGTTLASPYSNVWRILFSPAGNQTIGNIPPGGAVPPPSGAVPPPSGAVPPPSGAVPPPSGAVPPPSGAVPP